MTPHSVVSLFAGIGGFDLGFERAGCTIVAHVEKDAKCRELLASKWPNVVALDDVCTAGAHNLPPCDVVTFGFPCQDLSLAGRRAGLAGGRSGLFYEATRIIHEIKPAFCLFENVPGLLSSDYGRDFARVLMEMDRIGYHGPWRVLDAQWLGVAQRRRRVFGLFSRLDSGAERCAEILSIQESLRGHPAPRRETGQGVAPILEAGARTGVSTDDPRAGIGIGREDDPMFTLQAGKQHAVAGTLDGKCCAANRGSQANAKGADSDTKPGHLIAVNSGQGYWRESDKAGTLGTVARTLNARHDSSPCADRGMDVVAVPVAQVQWASGGGKVHNPTAQALRSGAEHNYQFAQVGMQVRRLTPTECERLQGFPDGWTEGFSDSCRYGMLGNAVCVSVAEWIAKRLVTSVNASLDSRAGR